MPWEKRCCSWLFCSVGSKGPGGTGWTCPLSENKGELRWEVGTGSALGSTTGAPWPLGCRQGILSVNSPDLGHQGAEAASRPARTQHSWESQVGLTFRHHLAQPLSLETETEAQRAEDYPNHTGRMEPGQPRLQLSACQSDPASGFAQDGRGSQHMGLFVLKPGQVGHGTSCLPSLSL